MGKYILAIDQGTTSTRAILFDHECNIIKMSQKEGQIAYPKPGWVEQDANQIWIATMAVIADVISSAKIDPSDIHAIGISNQRETTVIWDKNTGLPIYDAIVWQSRQTDGICDQWREKGYEDIIRSKTGLRIDPYFSASKIRWILDHVEGAQERAEKGELLFGNIDSWLVWKMSGQKVHITDVTNASRTLVFNIHETKWDDELLEMFNIPKCMLPEIRSTSEQYTCTSPVLFFNQEIPICSVVGDQQAALFGQGCFEKGMVKNTYGTGGFMLMQTGDELVESRNGLLSTIAWKIGDKIDYALEGSIFVSGSLMKWLRDQLGLFEHTKETSDMAIRAKTTGGVYIVPAFVGLGAPYWDDKTRGMITGMTLGTNRDQLVRAALESMAYQSRDVMEAMQEDSHIQISSLKVDGGAAANDFLLQFQADLIQCPVERFKIQELTAMGAAFLAGLASGYWTKDDLNIALERRFEPKRTKEDMDERYMGWIRAVKTCIYYTDND